MPPDLVEVTECEYLLVIPSINPLFKNIFG